MFKLSQRSLNKLDGVHPSMVSVVNRAIEITDVDFGVTFGTRTLAEQKELYNSGRSQTMNSKQLTAKDAMNAYIDLRRSQGRRPFIDAPHFEIM